MFDYRYQKPIWCVYGNTNVVVLFLDNLLRTRAETGVKEGEFFQGLSYSLSGSELQP